MVCPTSILSLGRYMLATNWVDYKPILAIGNYFGRHHLVQVPCSRRCRMQVPPSTVESPQFFGFSLFSNTKPYQSLLLQAFDLSFAIRQALYKPPSRSFRRAPTSLSLRCHPTSHFRVAETLSSLLPSLQASVVLLRVIAGLRAIDQPWRMKTPFDTT
jgi:hypothetical protein